MIENEIRELITEIKSENEIERGYLKKQLNMMKGLTFAMAGTFLLILITVAVLVPKLATTLNNANMALEQVTYIVAEAEEVLSSADSLMADNEEEIVTALEAISKLDIDTLNQSIQDLGNVISPLAKLFVR